MLRKFTSSSYFWNNVDFKQTLATLVHSKTLHIDLTLVDIDDEILEILRNCRNLKDVYLTKNKNDTLTTQGELIIHTFGSKIAY